MCMNFENAAKYMTVDIKNEVADLYGYVESLQQVGERTPEWLQMEITAYEKELANRGELG